MTHDAKPEHLTAMSRMSVEVPYGCCADRFFAAQDGTRLYYAERGSALSSRPVLLCLPGLARTGADFDDMAEALARRYRIIALDYRGRGRSQWCADWHSYHPRTLLDDIRHLLVVCGAHRVVAIGTSLGGALAMGLAAQAPTLLAGVVLNDIGTSLPTSVGKSLLDFIGRDHPQPDWATAADFLRRAFPDLPAYGPDGWSRIARRTFRPGDDGQLHVAWDPAIVKPFQDKDDTSDQLANLYRSLNHLPLMVVRGERSTILDAPQLRAMAVSRPNLTTVTVPGVGHAPSLGEPQALEALNGFLDRLH